MNQPKSVQLMLEKLSRSNPPHKRKKIEFATVIYATSVEQAARELEELAHDLREGGVGWVSHGGGYYMSRAWASCERDYSQDVSKISESKTV